MDIIIGIILFIAGILVFAAILRIDTNIEKTNKLLRTMLSEENPNRFSITEKATKLFDKATGKSI